ncbi:hypothetical protein C8Q77DRAFT_463355 [Trametes polyzona]|nr:hypothetical protein C8Q77DRAFT_463355 [Trametes polyzona]
MYYIHKCPALIIFVRKDEVHSHSRTYRASSLLAYASTSPSIHHHLLLKTLHGVHSRQRCPLYSSAARRSRTPAPDPTDRNVPADILRKKACTRRASDKPEPLPELRGGCDPLASPSADSVRSGAVLLPTEPRSSLCPKAA